MDWNIQVFDREFKVGGSWQRIEDKGVDVWLDNSGGTWVSYVRNDHGIVGFVGATQLTDEMINQAIITIGE
jgi:hypothetical protein